MASAAYSNGTLVVSNRYDHLGRRVQKIAPDGTHTFLYDGWRPVVEMVARPGGGTDRIEYHWGKDLSGTLDGAAGVGGLLYVKRNGAIYVPFGDAFGNVMGYWDENGVVVAEYAYDAFGRTVAKSGTMADMFSVRYSAKYFDAETGMYYYGKRYYVVMLCRWLTRDPIEERGGVNLYGFCGNNSIVFIDVKGESFDDVANFMAGVSDSLTFGLTGVIRGGINYGIYGQWDDPADVQSCSYSAGEYVEISVEIVVSLGGATLRHIAKKTIREGLEKSARQSFRCAYGLRESGGFVHHINPIKGHPGGALAQYPLPFEWAARGYWNMTWFATREEHMAAHETMKVYDKIDKWRTYTIGVRQGANRLMNNLNGSSDTQCWDSIDVKLNIVHTMGAVNGVPNSVSISYEKFGRGN